MPASEFHSTRSPRLNVFFIFDSIPAHPDDPDEADVIGSESSEQILFPIADKRARRTFGCFPIESAQQHHRTSGGLAHQDAGRGGKLVRNRHDCAGKFPSVAVLGSPVVFQGGEPRDANCHIHESLAPRPPKCIRYDGGATPQLLPQARGGSVGSLGKTVAKSITFHIRLIHTRVCADVAEMGFR